jgi:hypothetical protein
MNRSHFWIRCLLVVAATVGMTVLCWAQQEQWTFYFTHNSARLNVNGDGPRGNHHDELNTLDQVGVQMRQHADARAQIIGYAQPDEKDPPRLIGALAELRAERAKAYLVTVQGIDPARITTAGEKSSTRGPCAVITLRQE